MQNLSNVRLPSWIWEVATTKEELANLISAYVSKRYPGYRILKVKGKFAVCEIPR